MIVLVLISPQCTLAFSCAYASAYACAYLTNVNQALEGTHLAGIASNSESDRMGCCDDLPFLLNSD